MCGCGTGVAPGAVADMMEWALRAVRITIGSPARRPRPTVHADQCRHGCAEQVAAAIVGDVSTLSAKRAMPTGTSAPVAQSIA